MSRINAQTVSQGDVPSYALPSPDLGQAQIGRAVENLGDTVQNTNEQLTNVRRGIQMAKLEADSTKQLLDAQDQALQQKDPQMQRDTYAALSGQYHDAAMQGIDDPVVQRNFENMYQNKTTSFAHLVERNSRFLEKQNALQGASDAVDDAANRYGGADPVTQNALDKSIGNITNNLSLSNADRGRLLGYYNQQKNHSVIQSLQGKLANLPQGAEFDDHVNDAVASARAAGVPEHEITGMFLYAAQTSANRGDRAGVERWGKQLEDSAPKQYEDALDAADKYHAQYQAEAVPKILGETNQRLNNLNLTGAPAPYANVGEAMIDAVRQSLPALKNATGDKYPGDDAVIASSLKPYLLKAAQDGNQSAFDAIAPAVAKSNSLLVDDARIDLNRSVQTGINRDRQTVVDKVLQGVITGNVDPDAAKATFLEMAKNYDPGKPTAQMLSPEQYQRAAGELGTHSDAIKETQARQHDVSLKLSGDGGPNIVLTPKHDPQILDYLQKQGVITGSLARDNHFMFQSVTQPDRAAQMIVKGGENPLTKNLVDGFNEGDITPDLAATAAAIQRLSPAVNAKMMKELTDKGRATFLNVVTKTAEHAATTVDQSGNQTVNPDFMNAAQKAVQDTKDIDVEKIPKNDVRNALWATDKQESIGPAALKELIQRMPDQIRTGASPILNWANTWPEGTGPEGKISVATAQEYGKKAEELYPGLLAYYRNETMAKQASLDQAATITLWNRAPVAWNNSVHFSGGSRVFPQDQAEEMLAEITKNKTASQQAWDLRRNYIPEWVPGNVRLEGSTQVNSGSWRLRPIVPGASAVMVPGKDGGPPVEYRYLPSKQGLSFNEYSKKLADESAARKVQGTQQQQDDKSFANEAGPIESN